MNITRFTVSEGAKYARVGLSRFWELVRRGEIPAHREGRYVFVLARDIDEYIEQRASQAPYKHEPRQPRGAAGRTKGAVKA